MMILQPRWESRDGQLSVPTLAGLQQFCCAVRDERTTYKAQSNKRTAIKEHQSDRQSFSRGSSRSLLDSPSRVLSDSSRASADGTPRVIAFR